ncbi:MAG: helix-turn-helix domain-containing protein [Bryobacteraceae bacterium]|nr:helix-turn-helix domain-containing protein [Bryobacteraceae bacterium]
MSFDQFQRVAKALADPTRFDILEKISKEQEVPCVNLKNQLAVTQATLSHHLRELEDAELIETRREGRFVMLRHRPETMAGYLEELNRRLSKA